MIDIDTEQLLSPKEATRHPAFRNAKGRPGSLAAVYRAINPGARAVTGERVRLEVVKVPSGIRTSREAVGRFIAKLSNRDAAPTFSPAAQRRNAARVDAALNAAGIL